MNKKSLMVNIENIGEYIYIIRGQKIILDRDLAILYGVETRNLNKAVNRNKNRFPEDFIFQLTKEEWNNLKFHFGTSSSNWGGRRKLPTVFTEHGVAMVSNLLKSDRAIKVSVEIIRAFIRMRQILTSHKEISKELIELKSFLLKHAHKNDMEFRKIWITIEKLMNPPDNQRKIGFDLNQ